MKAVKSRPGSTCLIWNPSLPAPAIQSCISTVDSSIRTGILIPTGPTKPCGAPEYLSTSSSEASSAPEALRTAASFVSFTSKSPRISTQKKVSGM